LELRRFLESFWDDGLLAIKRSAEAGGERVPVEAGAAEEAIAR